MGDVGAHNWHSGRSDRTAIPRSRHLKPVSLALQHGVTKPGLTVADYGCGRGDDIRYLRLAGFQTTGCDPSFEANNPWCSADVVHLGYGLDVIEDVREQGHTLRKAFELTQRALTVSVRVEDSFKRL